MFPPGIEPGTFRVLGGCDNHYTTETELRSEAGETARLLQAGILCHKQSLVTGQDLDIWSIPHENGLKRGLSGLKQTLLQLCLSGRDRLVVRTLRCGRSNPGSNPGHGIFCTSTDTHGGAFFNTCGKSFISQSQQKSVKQRRMLRDRGI